MSHFWRNLTQVAIITPDADATMRALQQILKVGAFKVWNFREPELFDTTYDSKPLAWTMKLGITWIGDMQLEVIQPTGGKTLYQNYLDAKKRAGIQHILIDREQRSYKQLRDEFAKLGTPLAQEGKVSPATKVGGIRFPAFPRFIASTLSTHFGYTDTFDTLKISVEAAQYPPGFTTRTGVRVGAGDYWIGDNPATLEALPADCLLREMRGVTLVVNDLNATIKHYARFQDSALRSETVTLTDTLADTVIQIRRVELPLRTSTFTLVQPLTQHGIFAEQLNTRGEGAQFLVIQPGNAFATSTGAAGLTFHSALQDKNRAHQFWTHRNLPFIVQI